MDNVSFISVIALGCEIFGRLSPSNAWHIEAHQFRIEAHAKKKANLHLKAYIVMELVL
jgi:hypothetical protein